MPVTDKLVIQQSGVPDNDRDGSMAQSKTQQTCVYSGKDC